MESERGNTEFKCSKNRASRKRKSKLDEKRSDCIVAIGWNQWFAFESEEEEEAVALINKRSERRKQERAMQEKLSVSTETPQVFHKHDAEEGISNPLQDVDNIASIPLQETMVTLETVTENQRKCKEDAIQSIRPLDRLKLKRSNNDSNFTRGNFQDGESYDSSQTSCVSGTSPTSRLKKPAEIFPYISARCGEKRNVIHIIDDNESPVPSDEEMDQQKLDPAPPKRLGKGCARTSVKSPESKKSHQHKVITTPWKRQQNRNASTSRRNGQSNHCERNEWSNAEECQGSPISCPVCNKVLFGDIKSIDFNDEVHKHIDNCLATSSQ